MSSAMVYEREQIEAWIRKLGSDKQDEFEEAKAQLLQVGASAIDTLLYAMREEKGRVSIEVARLISEYQDDRVFIAMCEMLSSSNPLLGQIAVNYLEAYGNQSVTALLDALPRSHYMVQLSIIAMLESIGDVRAVAPLMHILHTSGTDSPAFIYTLIQTLGALGDPRAVAIIRRYKNHADDHIRNRAEEALKRLGFSS